MDNPKDTFAPWLAKIEILEDQINKLEKLKEFPIISISVFLLKSQLIEFELTKTIPVIDLHLNSIYLSKKLRRKTRVPESFNQHTLRKLVREMEAFEGSLVKELNQELGELVNLRDQFTHHLFSLSKDLSMLVRDADKGIKIANNVIIKLRIFQEELK